MTNLQSSNSVPKSLARRKSLRIGAREFAPFADYKTLLNVKLTTQFRLVIDVKVTRTSVGGVTAPLFVQNPFLKKSYISSR